MSIYSNSINAIILTPLLIISSFCSGSESTPEIANLTKTPPAISLAKPYQNNIDLTQYWVSEKLDGVRAYWNGHKLLSRGGTTINAPVWFTEGFPDQALDGELWTNRGGFQQTVSIVRKNKPDDNEWREITYQVFDLPKSPFIFDVRLKQLKELLNKDNHHTTNKKSTINLIHQWRIDNHQQLISSLSSLVSQGAEGLMLRRGDSYHQTGRNNNLLKVKPSYDDEATVIGYIAGKGKNSGRMGSLLVQWKPGLQFHIGTGFTDEQRVAPPAIGSIISFRFFGLTEKGIPRHASFLRIRTDADL